MSNDNKYKNQLENCYKIIGASDSSSKIVLLKGGSYKIKQYYLEDNVPRDIRGASMNLAYVEEKVIPNYIENHFNCHLQKKRISPLNHIYVDILPSFL